MDQQDVDAIAWLSYSGVISDSIYADTDTLHPRMYGAFPRFYQEYVRERNVLGTEEAIRKMPSMPVQRMQIAGRSLLREGEFCRCAGV